MEPIFAAEAASHIALELFFEQQAPSFADSMVQAATQVQGTHQPQERYAHTEPIPLLERYKQPTVLEDMFATYTFEPHGMRMHR